MTLLQTQIRNNILARLSTADFALLADGLEPLDGTLAMVLIHPDAPISHLFFLETGVASIVAISPEGQIAEGGIIGREGFITPSVMLGADRIPHRIEMQIAGRGHRIATGVVIDAARASQTLRASLLLFAQTLIVQTAYTLLANAVHQVDERLARWLLMCHDRSESDDIALTHHFMSVMLSVRRPSVTNALHVLEGNGFIHAERGYVTMRDRPALEEFAGDAYGKPEAEYRRLIGPL